MVFYAIVGERIRQCISKGQYAKVEDFCRASGISKSTLSEILNGKNDPKLTTLAKICAELQITLSDLLRDPRIDSWVRKEAKGYVSPQQAKRKRPKKAAKSSPK